MATRKTPPITVPDPAINPDHYTAGEIECIEALAAMAGTESHIDHCVQSAVAYLWRWRRKDGTRDLAKAAWYIERAQFLAATLEQINTPTTK